MAKAVDRAERTVRKWGDPDADEKINAEAMVILDTLFEQSGGQGFPLYEAYGQLLNVAVAECFVSQFDLLRSAADLVKETGEAEAAVMRVVLPGSSEADRKEAVRELLEAIETANRVLPQLEQLQVSGGDPVRAPP